MDTIDDYLEALASHAPTPGGGSAAALTGAFGAALVAMVARITSDNPKYAERYTDAVALVHRADGLRAQLARARGDDERAYGEVVAAGALSRATPDERAARTAALQAALVEAAAAPLMTATYAGDVVRAAVEALALGNPHLESDLGCAAELGAAALASAAYNVRVNHAYLKDAATVAAQAAELERLERDARDDLARVREALRPH